MGAHVDAVEGPRGTWVNEHSSVGQRVQSQLLMTDFQGLVFSNIDAQIHDSLRGAGVCGVHCPGL